MRAGNTADDTHKHNITAIYVHSARTPPRTHTHIYIQNIQIYIPDNCTIDISKTCQSACIVIFIHAIRHLYTFLVFCWKCKFRREMLGSWCGALAQHTTIRAHLRGISTYDIMYRWSWSHKVVTLKQLLPLEICIVESSIILHIWLMFVDGALKFSKLSHPLVRPP